MLLLLCTSLRTLCTVFGTGLHPLCDALSIKGSADNVVTNTRKVPYTAASDKNDAVLLKVVADTGNVRGNFHSVAQTYSGDFTKSRVRLLRGRGTDSGANAALLRAVLVNGNLFLGVLTSQQSRSGGFGLKIMSSVVNELVKSRHRFPPFFSFYRLGMVVPKAGTTNFKL